VLSYIERCSEAGAEPLFYGVGPVGDSRPASWPPTVTRGYFNTDH
jgi:hypothetical protein